MTRSLSILFAIFVFAPGTVLYAADEQGHGHDHPHATPADTGWTTQGGTATQADSLAAFRPDSLKDATLRAAESAPSPFAAKATPRDSADSVAALLRGRRPTLSFHAGIAFVDLDAKDIFQRALDARLRRDSLQTLQPYEPVHLAMPFGVQATFPAGPYFDLLAKTHSFWYRQTAVLGKSGSTKGEEFFAVQANLGGLGLRYYVPSSLLSVNGQLGLYVQGTWYWLLGGGELYGSGGNAEAEFDPAGSGWEVQLGFNRAVTRSLGIHGNLGYITQGFDSDAPWTAVVKDGAPSGKAKWNLAAVQASFHFAWHFGVAGKAEEKPAATAPTGPVAPK